MPDLVFPASIIPAVDGDPILSSEIGDLVFDRTSPLESLAIINGKLDVDNLDASTVINAEHTQRGSNVAAGGAAGTANLDYKSRFWFNNYVNSGQFSFESDDLVQGRAIPGGGKTFYLRDSAPVRLGWQIAWTNTSSTDVTLQSVIYLKIHSFLDNPDSVSSQARSVRRVFTSNQAEGYRRNRYWTGHHLEVLDGNMWHTAQLYVIAHKNIGQTRIWARNMNYLRLG